jgi:hypothetical protein
MPQLKDIIDFALKSDIKKQKPALATTTLDKWVQSNQEQKCQSEFADSGHFHQAY